MRDSRPIQLLASLSALGVAGLAFAAVTDLPPSFHKPLQKSIGQAIAQETLRHWKPGGTVSVFTRDTSEFPHPEADAVFASFQSSLLAAGTPIDSVQSLQLDPLRPLAVPPGDFFELIRRAPAGSVIVSFMGPPELTPEQRSQLTVIKPAIIAFCPGNIPLRSNLRELLQAGIVRAAVVDRFPPPSKPTGFEGTYALVHAEDAPSLPSQDRNLP